jgi:UDP-N-acetylmuramyl tripeptide synthase
VLRLRIAMAAGRIAGRLSRLVGRGGSAVPGLVAERIDPRVIERLAGTIPRVVVVTGTNGKTTTTKLLVGILEAAGMRVLTNPAGSNLARGIASRLIEAASWRGDVDADAAVFEIDEAAVRGLGPRLAPEVVVVTNLARDQLDRYGELDTTAAHIRAALSHAECAVLNSDDPLVAGLAGTAGTDRFYGGSAEVRVAMPDDRSLYGDEPAARRGPEPGLVVESAEATDEGQRVRFGGDLTATVGMRLPGVYNAYNAAAALAAALRLGAPPEVAVDAIASAAPAWGRGQVIAYRGRSVRLLLVKNPSGFNHAIRLLAEIPVPAPVLVSINDHTADGRDVSWLWDARIEDLAATPHRFATGGTRALDMAVRFKYAGMTPEWSEPDPRSALDRFVASVPEGGTAYVVPTYTAMLDLLRLLLPDTRRREAWT